MRRPNSRALRKLVGRRIAAIHEYTFADGRGGRATNPVVVLDDGTCVSFVVQETEGDYGVTLVVTPMPPRPKV